jgi:hypothetical protein
LMGKPSARTRNDNFVMIKPHDRLVLVS